MSDFSVVQSALGLPSADLGNATSETQYTSANAQGAVASGKQLMCRIPASNVLKGRPFLLRVYGRVVTGTTATLTPKVYFGGSSTIASNTSLYAPGAGQSLATAKSNWGLECHLYWDSTSKVLNGFAEGFNGTTLYDIAAITQQTSVDLSSTEVNWLSTAAGTDLMFTVTGIFSAGNASNSSIIELFEIVAV